MIDNLKIFEKMYQLILWLYGMVNKFPKSQRFVLGQHIENIALAILTVGYIRYMDDFLIFGNSKKELNEIKGLVGEFLYKYLFLILHPSKATVFPVSLGVSFLGYNIFKTHITLRKSTVNRFIKRVKKFKDNQNSTSVTQEEILNNEVKFGEGVASWLVYAKQASSYGLITCINKQNNFLGYLEKKKEYHFVI